MPPFQLSGFYPYPLKGDAGSGVFFVCFDGRVSMVDAPNLRSGLTNAALGGMVWVIFFMNFWVPNNN